MAEQACLYLHQGSQGAAALGPLALVPPRLGRARRVRVRRRLCRVGGLQQAVFQTGGVEAVVHVHQAVTVPGAVLHQVDQQAQTLRCRRRGGQSGWRKVQGDKSSPAVALPHQHSHVKALLRWDVAGDAEDAVQSRQYQMLLLARLGAPPLCQHR